MTFSIHADYALHKEPERYDLPVRADLLLAGDTHAEADGEIILTLLQERPARPQEHNVSGDFSLRLEVADGESLTLLVRAYGEIVACLIVQIDTREESLFLLHPKAGYGLHLAQRRVEALPGEARAPGGIATPATTLLAQMVEAVEAHYAQAVQPLPATFCQLWPCCRDAVLCNEQSYSAAMLACLANAVEEAGLLLQARVAALWPAVCSAVSHGMATCP